MKLMRLVEEKKTHRSGKPRLKRNVPSTRPNPFRLESLEPRILLSADPLGLLEPAIEPETPPEPPLQTNSEEGGGLETQAGATEVVITPNPQSQTVPADSAVSIQVDYESGAVNNSGLGLRLHFDSTQLSFDSLSDIFSDGPLFAQQVQAETAQTS